MGKQRKQSSGFSNTPPERTRKTKPDKCYNELSMKEQQADSLIKQGKLQEAEEIYRRLIATGKTNHKVFGNLGILCGMQRKFDEAIELFKQALQVKSNNPSAHNNLGILLKEKGDLNGAINSYKKALIFNENLPDTHYNLGVALQERGDLTAAINSYKKAIKLNPNHTNAYNNLGASLKEQGDSSAAISSYNNALKLEPNNPNIHNNLGAALQEKGDLSRAITSYNTALKLEPNNPDIHNNLGTALTEQGDISGAIISYTTALKLEPNDPYIHNNLGTALKEQGDVSGAITSYKTALKLKPDFTDAYYNIGIAFQEEGELATAITAYNTALKFRPDFPEAQNNLSMAELQCGDYKRGWERYTYRFESNQKTEMLIAKPSCEQWNGKKLKKGSQILIVSEQGLGDTMQFMRYVLALRNKEILVSFCAQSKLHALIQTSGIDPSPLTPEQANSVNEGYWIPLLSVPRYLGVNPSNPIITDPYISTSDKLVKKWKSILSVERRPIIGINWQGNPKQERMNSIGRSLPLETFATFAIKTNATFLSLQKGFGSEQLDTCSFKDHFVNSQHEINDTWNFLETAAIIANCDLIITSDTSVAHLAGGMGKTTWLLLQKVAEWRWGLKGDSSFWYPSMHLFRQNEKGNWNEVMERVSKAFNESFGERKTTNEPNITHQSATKTNSGQEIHRPIFLTGRPNGLIQRGNPSANETTEQSSTITTHKTSESHKNASPNEHCITGDRHMRNGDYKLAELSYNDAILIDKVNPRALFNLALIKRQLGQPEEALKFFQKAADLKPDLAEAYINIGAILQEGGDSLAAIQQLKKALKIQPKSAYAFNNLGNCLRSTGDHEAAIRALNKATKIKPDFAEAHNNLGLACQNSGDFAEAAKSFQRAVTLNPSFAEAFSNFGLLLQEIGNVSEAINNFQTALQINSNLVDVRCNLGMTELLQGDYKSGLKNYEFRFSTEKGLHSLLSMPGGPVWDGSSLPKNKKLILIAEQGLGDTLHFMRYTKVLKSRGLSPILCAQPKLNSLIKASDPGLPLISADDALEDRHSSWIPLLSTLKYLQVSQTTPLINDPYIKPSDSLTSKWKNIISQEDGLVIGINWQGNPDHEKSTSKGRSLPLEFFLPIAKLDNVTLLSLQKGYGSNQLDQCSFRDKFAKCQEQVSNTWEFNETAAIAANCDLIITSDTSIAHLAGGMGKTTWLLLKKVPEWRWGLSGETCAWYPSMRLFRQDEHGNWGKLLEKVTDAVRELLEDS